MSFLDTIIEKDKELFLFLNSLGVESWDQFWMIVTNQFSWIPLFALLLFLVFKAYGWKKSLLIMVVAALLVGKMDPRLFRVGRKWRNGHEAVNLAFAHLIRGFIDALGQGKLLGRRKPELSWPRLPSRGSWPVLLLPLACVPGF